MVDDQPPRPFGPPLLFQSGQEGLGHAFKLDRYRAIRGLTLRLFTCQSFDQFDIVPDAIDNHGGLQAIGIG